METKIAHFNYIDTIELPEWVIDSCPKMGDCSNAIAEFMEDSEVKKELEKINSASLVKELSEYGAWDDEQLQDHNENLSRILWIAIGQIWDEN